MQQNNSTQVPKKITTTDSSKVNFKYLKHIPYKAMDWIGSVGSLVFHTIIFAGSFILGFLGVNWDRILLVVTTIVSLEAIYLNIFIQMAVNRTTQSLQGVEEDLEGIQEDVDEIQEDVGEIHENVGELQEDVEEIQKDFDVVQEDVEVLEGHVHEMKEDIEEISEAEEPSQVITLDVVQKQLQTILGEIDKLKKK